MRSSPIGDRAAPRQGGRPNQRRRTRKDLLQAASRLAKQGRTPTLDEVAAEAMVSRATAYRYFPNTEALLLEAALDIAVPEGDELFADDASNDPVARLHRADAALNNMIAANEGALRVMLANSMQRRNAGESEERLPVRQNRRSALIEAALAPVRREFTPSNLDMLSKALALVIGTEAMIVFKDVLQVDDQEARKIRRWMIRALVEAARRPRS